MEGKIISYRRGSSSEKECQYVIDVKDIKTRKEVMKKMGAKVEWMTPSGKCIKGKITRPHGNNGQFVARFRKGLPGQAIGKLVKIE